MNKRISTFCSFVLVGLIAFFYACDTPQTIAWSYYDCAKDTLAAGDPFAAKHFLDACNTTADKGLALKVDSLKRVIDKAIEEKQDQNTKAE